MSDDQVVDAESSEAAPLPAAPPPAFGRRWRRWFWGAGIVVALFGMFPFIAEARIKSLAAGRIYRSNDTAIPQTQVALVLGALVKPNGKLSDMLRDRVDTAVDLYKAGKCSKILMSGDNGKKDYDEVTPMRDYAISRGVPGEDVVRDYAGFRTLDSVFRARDVFGQTRLIVVSQEFHLPRALYIAETAGIQAVGVIADRQQYPTALARSQRRETVACAAAMLDLHLFGTQPRFLGAMVGLNGNAQ